ncbi:MAG: hypothetical protein NZT61_01235 [Deltaproteobacteria bacterium]|nr:hypothetical protein [Deltaproteobacteria bacterium]
MDPKIKQIQTLLSFDYIYVFIDPTVEGVKLPEHVSGCPYVTLKLSRLFQSPMFIREDHIEAILKFNGQYFNCILPANSIIGAVTPAGHKIFWVGNLQQEETHSNLDKKKKPNLKRIK